MFVSLFVCFSMHQIYDMMMHFDSFWFDEQISDGSGWWWWWWLLFYFVHKSYFHHHHHHHRRRMTNLSGAVHGLNQSDFSSFFKKKCHPHWWMIKVIFNFEQKKRFEFESKFWLHHIWTVKWNLSQFNSRSTSKIRIIRFQNNKNFSNFFVENSK